MKNILALLIIVSSFFSCSDKSTVVKELKTNESIVTIDDRGNIVAIEIVKNATNYIYQDSASSLMAISYKNEILYPIEAKNTPDGISLFYENNVQAQIKILEKESYVTFELVSLSNSEEVDIIVWGPFNTTIDQVIGETVGVVQSEKYAVGIQSLNAKTLGGYPWRENDCLPQLDIFDQDNPSDLSEEGKPYVLYRVEAAKPTVHGSSLQAYCRDRSKDRNIENMGHDIYHAPAYNDGGYIGSKIALFACSRENILPTIGDIEVNEGLPHPMVEGKWNKTTPLSTSAYLIMDIRSKDVQKAIDITKKAGLKYLYLSNPFKTWGHFKFDKIRFPDGIENMKECVDMAAENGIALGIHTLSNFISTSDAYVTPIPDKRLAKVGSTVLSRGMDKSQTEILIESPIYFNQFKNNSLKTVMIDEELIRYASVSKEEPWALLDCQRGAYGTKAAVHAKGNPISKLADHAYKVFLTDAELGEEVAKNLADIFNETGLRQISFDGIEGNRSTAMGNYGEILFAKSWYDNLNQDIKDNCIVDASRTSHYFWHIYTRMNWGEPWYGDFRESQVDYRLKNQRYFKRNLMPAMLGWFLMSTTTSLEDIEWLLARSAAYDAGYAFVANFVSVSNNGYSDQILTLIGEWEKVRLAQLFTEEQKQRMEDVENEFTLKTINDKEWVLRQVYSSTFKHLAKVRQPGEPLYSKFDFNLPTYKQALNFIMTAVDCDIDNISLEMDNYKKIELPVSLKKGEHIKYSGGDKAYVYSKKWQIITTFNIDANSFKLGQGDHSINVDCSFSNQGKEALLKLEIRAFGKDEKIVME